MQDLTKPNGVIGQFELVIAPVTSTVLTNGKLDVCPKCGRKLIGVYKRFCPGYNCDY